MIIIGISGQAFLENKTILRIDDVYGEAETHKQVMK